MIRVGVGFLVSALWLPLLLLVTSGEYGTFWFTMIAFFTVPLTVCLAVPSFLFAYKRFYISIVSCLLFGFIIGLIGILLFWLLTNQQAMVGWSPALAVIGLFSGLVFWFTGVWKNEFLQKSA